MTRALARARNKEGEGAGGGEGKGSFEDGGWGQLEIQSRRSEEMTSETRASEKNRRQRGEEGG